MEAKKQPPRPTDPPNAPRPAPLRPRGDSALPVTAAAVLVGVVCGLPHVLMPLVLRAQGQEYAPLVTRNVTALTYDETTWYAPKVREVLDGHLLSADPHGLEHKGDTRFLGQSWLDAICVGALGLVLGRSVPAVYVVCDFLLPPLCFLLLFVICRRLGAPQWVAIAASLFAVLAHGDVTLPIAFAANPSPGFLAERLHLTESTRPLEFCRLLVPQFTFIGLGLVLLGLIRLSDQPRLRTALWTALTLGALFYCYVYYWTFALVGGLLLLAASLASPGRRRAVGLLALALGLAALLGLPVVYQGVASDGYSGKAELQSRLSYGGRHVRWAYQKHDLALLALLLLAYPRRRREYLPLAAFMVAPYLCILGARVLPLGTTLDWHWLGRCWQPWAAVSITLLPWAWIDTVARRRAERRGETGSALLAGMRQVEARTALGFGIFAGLLFLYAANVQARYSLQMASRHTLPPGVRQALTELRLRAPRDSVVMSLDPDVLGLVPVYTGCNVYLPYCILTPASTEELIDRAAVTFATYGVTDGAITRLLSWPGHESEEELARNQSTLSNWLFHRTLTKAGTPPESLAAIKARTRFHGPNAIRETADRYHVDFIWWGPLERSVGDKTLERKLADALYIDAGDVRVYRVRSTQQRKAEGLGRTPGLSQR